MTHENLVQLLNKFRHGDLSIDDAVGMLKKVPFQDLGFAKVDHHRGIRKGFPEVIWGQDKTGQQIAKITKEIASEGDYVLITRLEEEKAADVRRLVPASVLIVVAGREGALPSVVGGLVDRPVIAVPTSVGYGASFGGVTALLAMLNSCAAGVTVVNIDNGFGAAAAASLINHSSGGQK